MQVELTQKFDGKLAMKSRLTVEAVGEEGTVEGTVGGTVEGSVGGRVGGKSGGTVGGIVGGSSDNGG